MIILGIESSCDDTSAAIVCDNIDPKLRILSNIISSQIHTHMLYGGVIPEYAARMHTDKIDLVINDAMKAAEITFSDIDAIAATAGPGLIGGVLVGVVTAKTIAMLKNKPFMAINHLEGHLLTTRLCYDVEFPYLLLLTSGGHFIFAEVFDVGKYKILGETLDDAAGESFDKVAKMLGLSYPGGPSIEKYAIGGDKNRFKYTIPLQRRNGCDVSFSGIKTATRIYIESIGKDMNDQDKRDVAASFQNIVIKSIIRQINKAYNMTTSNPKSVVVSGGVAANTKLREELLIFAKDKNLEFYAPPLNLCSDNAAMIAWCAIERVKQGYQYSDLNSVTRPRWPITQI